MKRHNIHPHCFQVSTTERVSSSPSILLKALFPPFGSLWRSKTSRWNFLRYNLDHIHSNWKNLYLIKLKTCPQGNHGVVEPGQPGLPGLLAHVALHSDYVGRRIQPVHRHHHLSRWVLAKVGHHYHRFCHHHHHDLNHQQVHHLVCLLLPLWYRKLCFSPQDNQTAAWIWDNVEGGIFGEVFMTLKLDLSGCQNNSTARQQK